MSGSEDLMKTEILQSYMERVQRSADLPSNGFSTREDDPAYHEDHTFTMSVTTFLFSAF